MMVTLESLLSGWFYGHKIRTELLSGLGRAASIVLFLYVAVRAGDLLIRGKVGYAFDGSWQGSLFLFELLVSALLPAVLLSFRKIRTSVAGLSVCSVLTVLGMIGYRFNICIVTFTRPDGLPYLPAWTELAVSAGVVSGAILTFMFFVEHFKVYDDAPGEHAEPFIPPSQDTAGIPDPYPAAVASPRRYSLIAVVSAALTVGFLPDNAMFGPQPRSHPVWPTRTVDAFIAEVDDSRDRLFVLPGLTSPEALPADAPQTAAKLMLINGDRDAQVVPFNHALHVAQLGGEGSCGQCHHQNIPFDQNTACYQCHRDMYEVTDTFDHAYHVDRLGGNSGCVQCHADEPDRKTRQTAKACQACHAGMMVEGSRVRAPEQGMTGFAPGYMDAMHGLCIACHEEEAQNRNRPHFARCDICHRPEIEPVDTAQLVLKGGHALPGRRP
jgi:hypothetical protein